jgi:hypothetical protein
MLIGLFFLRVRKRGVRKRGGRSNSSNNPWIQTTQRAILLESYFLRLNFSPQNSSSYFSKHALGVEYVVLLLGSKQYYFYAI